MAETTYVLFDLDGTLSDPLEGISKSINYALGAFGYPLAPEAELARFIGPPLDTTFVELTAGDDQSHIMALVEKFRERFREKGYRENKLYPGVKQALESLYAREIPLGVCTSKRRDFAEKILAMFGLDHLFDFVSGGDVGISKSSQIRTLLEMKKISRASVMIGDRDSDILAARENDLCGYGVIWGYGSREELENAGSLGLFEAPDEWNHIFR
ncbi:MAG: HAD hydrolase-like protein [Desulfobacter sp.]|nr:MAG: HAD hydrolase-like protein [Desulfobacter sp.]